MVFISTNLARSKNKKTLISTGDLDPENKKLSREAIERLRIEEEVGVLKENRENEKESEK